MNGGTKTTVSLTALVALAVGVWQLWPAVDGIFFTEAEGADLADINRRQFYLNRRDIAELNLKHATDEIERAKYQAMVDYYDAKVARMNEGDEP